MADRRFAAGVHVFGAGGHAKVVIATLIAAGHEVLGAWDDDAARHGAEVLGVRIAGAIADCPADATAVLAIGSNRARARLAAENPHRRFATVVHPRACVHESVRLGHGTVVFAGAILQPEATVGAHVIVNTGASVDHDGRIADFAHLAVGARLGGGVTVGAGALVGIGAALLPSVVVGEWATVGAGAVVTRSVEAHACVVGSPARPRLSPPAETW